MICLDLGCGIRKKEGYVGVDIRKTPVVDVIADLEKPFPFRDNSVDKIYCAHLIEHLNNFIGFMNECYRILKPKGEFEIIAPYYTSIGAWQDPTHVRAITEKTFDYFDADKRKAMKVEHYSIKTNFKIKHLEYVYNDKFSTNPEREELRKTILNVVNEIRVILIKY